MSTTTPDPTPITFEDGYRRLQEIAERVNSEEVPVHEMCDLFAEGKGLDQALTTYLAQQKARVEQIERGEGVTPFRVVAPNSEVRRDNGHVPSSGVPLEVPELRRSPPPADDDIPF